MPNGPRLHAIVAVRKIRIIIMWARTHLVCQGRTFRPASGEFPMKTMIFAALGVLALSVGVASAQGGGATASTKAYGQKWAEIQRAKCHNAK
jgi:hypothetical protein